VERIGSDVECYLPGDWGAAGPAIYTSEDTCLAICGAILKAKETTE
jgi:hypothetical protein